MKSKKIVAALMLISTLISCTTESNNEAESEKETQPANTILVKKIIKTYSINDISTVTYKYDGNKIISESSDEGFVATYTYSGNVITKIVETVNNTFQRSKEYTYANGKVATKAEKDNSGTDSYSYTYNSNGTVSYSRTRTGSENTTGLLTIENGNIIKNEEFYGGQYPSTSTYIYGYDTKSNPFKNVLGFNLLLDTNEIMFSSNNLTEDGGGVPTLNYMYKYNENGFPIERKPSSGNQDETYQYFY